MRGLIVALAGIVGTMILRRWTAQDRRESAFQKALEEHREKSTAALEEHRKATESLYRDLRAELVSQLNQVRNSNDLGFQHLNETVATIAGTAGEIRALMAERYVTKPELTALEERIEKRFKLCEASCPPNCGT